MSEPRQTEDQAGATSRGGLLGIFCNHPVAANLLMAMLLLAGFGA